MRTKLHKSLIMSNLYSFNQKNIVHDCEISILNENRNTFHNTTTFTYMGKSSLHIDEIWPVIVLYCMTIVNKNLIIAFKITNC